MGVILNTPTQPSDLHQVWLKHGMFQPPVFGSKLPTQETIELAEYIHKHGLWLSVVVDEDNAVLGGECLLQHYYEVGVEWVPVVQIVGLSISQKTSFNDAYNMNNGGQS